MRRSSVTTEAKAAFLAALREGATFEVAARSAGTSRRSLLRLRQADERFALDVDEAADAGCDMLEQQLVKYGTGEAPIKNAAQVTALFGVLRKRRPEQWREQQRLDLGGVKGQPVQVKAVPVSLAEIFRVARECGVDLEAKIQASAEGEK